MEGTPAKFEILISINLLILLLLPYSSKYNAVATPNGTEMIDTKLSIHMLPYNADLIPALAGNLEGKFSKKLNDNLLNPVIETW